MTQITDHLAKVRMRVTNAARVAGRAADDVTIVAVSKRQPAAAIERAHRAGQRQFGESFVQEALAKMQVLDLPDIEWHFIGRVQANKTRDIARAFDWVHTVDRLKVARRLDEQRPHYAPRLNVCLQINLADEPQKGGIAAEDAADLAPCVAELPRLHLRGLMTIPPEGAGVEESTAWFARLRELQQRIVVGGVPLDTLSMGMSADFEAAIASGSTMIRVGTAIFGARET